MQCMQCICIISDYSIVQCQKLAKIHTVKVDILVKELIWSIAENHHWKKFGLENNWSEWSRETYYGRIDIKLSIYYVINCSTSRELFIRILPYHSMLLICIRSLHCSSSSQSKQLIPFLSTRALKNACPFICQLNLKLNLIALVEKIKKRSRLN